MNQDLFAQDRALREAHGGDTPGRSEMFVTPDDIRIHHRTFGDGPAVILLHGFPQHGLEWRFVTPQLVRAGYRVVVLDLRGFGRSDKPLAGYDVLTVTGDLEALVQHLGLERFSLVGHDLGAAVAYAYAATHTDEVGRLALIEAGFSGLPTWKGQPTWHALFLAEPDLPEALISARGCGPLTVWR